MNSQENNAPFTIGIVGSGTAGLISAIMLRKAFPLAHIFVVSSSKIGIIGVGEGSTEHWRIMMDLCDIPLEEMIEATSATHKYGIRFEGWTNHTPDYFHSVSAVDDIFAWGLHATYLGYFEQEKLLTNQTASIGLIRDKISRTNLHKSTNQFHFDTHKLNEYFTSLAFRRAVKFADAEVREVRLNSEHGTIESVITDDGISMTADFWFDASGFKRVLMSELGADKWVSYSDYLLCDKAIPFPTESDPNGRIRAYTRAIAASSGWMWEIPTQERRGNGYVFSSQFITTEQAIAEAEKISGYKIANPRVIDFDAGYIDQCWVKNCCAVGLASSFVEPLEATSIGSTIQQVKSLIPYLASYMPGHTASQKHFNKGFAAMMRNILSMIRLHYYSDRKDTEFWKAMSEMPLNPELEEMVELWRERPPSRYDFESNSGEMFLSPHMSHVAQGQGIINPDMCTVALNRLGIREQVLSKMDEYKHSRHSHELVDHATALREITLLDQEWSR